METILTYSFVFIIGVVGSFVGAVAAGAALITVRPVTIVGSAVRFGSVKEIYSTMFNTTESVNC